MTIRMRVSTFFSMVLKKLGLKNPIYYIGGSDALPPPLDTEAESRYIARLARDDVEAKSKLIEHNLRLVVYIARKFENTGVGIEDLVSIGTIGLIKAILISGTLRKVFPTQGLSGEIPGIRGNLLRTK